MKLLLKIKDVRQLVGRSSTYNILYIDINKKLLHLDLDFTNTILIDDLDCEIVQFWGNRLLINEDYIFSSNEKEYLFNSNNIFSSLIINDKKLLIREIDFTKETVKFGVFNFQTKEIIDLGILDKNPRKMLSENCFFTIFENNLFCYSINNLNLLWQHSFSDLLEGIDIKQAGNMVVYEEKFYFYLYDNKGNNRATICLDINTGEIFDIYNNFGGDLYLFGNKIGVAAYDIVQVLDLVTNQIKEYDFSKILDEHNLKIGWNGNIFTEDGLLYFIGTNKAKNKVGILDLNTEELLWHISFEIPETEYNINQQVRNIELHNDRLYVHCSDNTLHIFE